MILNLIPAGTSYLEDFQFDLLGTSSEETDYTCCYLSEKMERIDGESMCGEEMCGLVAFVFGYVFISPPES